MSKHRIFALFLMLAVGLVLGSPAFGAPDDEAGLVNRIQSIQRVLKQLDACISKGEQGQIVLSGEPYVCMTISQAQLADGMMTVFSNYLESGTSWEEARGRVSAWTAAYVLTSKKNVAALRIVRGNLLKKLDDAKKRLAALRAQPAAPLQPGEGNACNAGAGDWSSVVPGRGSSMWHLRGTGGSLSATETGWGNATGSAQFGDGQLRIDFDVNNVTGYYEWQLDADCKNGKGWLVYTAGMSGRYPSTVSR